MLDYWCQFFFAVGFDVSERLICGDTFVGVTVFVLTKERVCRPDHSPQKQRDTRKKPKISMIRFGDRTVSPVAEASCDRQRREKKKTDQAADTTKFIPKHTPWYVEKKWRKRHRRQKNRTKRRKTHVKKGRKKKKNAHEKMIKMIKKKQKKSARPHIASQHLRQLVPQMCVVVEQLILFQDLDVEVRGHAVILHQSHQNLVTQANPTERKRAEKKPLLIRKLDEESTSIQAPHLARGWRETCFFRIRQFQLQE